MKQDPWHIPSWHAFVGADTAIVGVMGGSASCGIDARLSDCTPTATVTVQSITPPGLNVLECLKLGPHLGMPALRGGCTALLSCVSWENSTMAAGDRMTIDVDQLHALKAEFDNVSLATFLDSAWRRVWWSSTLLLRIPEPTL
jgi:hypothetical protein